MKEKTISEILDEMIGDMCKNYCKYPGQVDDDTLFDYYCANCPLNRL